MNAPASKAHGRIEEIAPAKINLYLHIGAVRPDGLHDLESLFVFTDAGDRLIVAPADKLSLAVEGPFAEMLSGAPIEDNLVWRAAIALSDGAGISPGAAIILDKRLPVAAGIGGGSADAAAALRALVSFWAISIDEGELQSLAFDLGADVPACLTGAPVYVSGAGEIIKPGPSLPDLGICLVNPGVAMPTGPVFGDFDAANPDPTVPLALKLGEISSLLELESALSKTKNDLQPHAIARASIIGDTINFLSQCDGAKATRMSGSGATVFSLFAARAEADKAAGAARKKGWWSLAAGLASKNRLLTGSA